MKVAGHPRSSFNLLRSALPWIVAVLIGFWVVFIFHDLFGLALDDPIQALHGELCLDYFLSFGGDQSFHELLNLELYGSIFEQSSAALHRLLRKEDFLAYRSIVCGLAALSTVLLTAGLLQRMGHKRWMWFGALFLATAPQFWGQAFINSKDVPFAAVFTAWILCYGHWYLKGMGRDRWMVLTALALGLLLSIRITALPFVAFSLFAAGTAWILEKYSDGEDWNSIIRGFPWISHCLILVVAWAIMVMLWPTAHANPFLEPIQAFLVFLDFPWKVLTMVAGTQYRANAAPVYTFSVTHFLSQPLWCYPLYLLGVAGLISGWKTGDRRQRLFGLLLFFWITPLFALSWFGFFHPYNGVRQTLFLWPAYAILAACGAAYLSSLLNPERRPWVVILTSLIIISNGLILAAKHPLPYTYWNPVVRLFPKGINGFDADYHALSYRLAAEWLDRVAYERHLRGEPPPSVAVAADQYFYHCFNRYSVGPLMRKFAWEKTSAESWPSFEFVVVLHPFEWLPFVQDDFQLDERQIAHRIENDGQVYTLIYQSVDMD